MVLSHMSDQPSDPCTEYENDAMSPKMCKQKHERPPDLTDGKGSSSCYTAQPQLSASLLMSRLAMGFQPFFVEKYWRSWYTSTNLSALDRVSLQADVVIWLVCILAVEPWSWFQLHTSLYLVLSILSVVLYNKHTEWYMRHRTAITSLRWWLTYPFTWTRLGAKVAHATGPWQAVIWHLVVQPCAYHGFVTCVFYMDSWHIVAFNTLLDIVVLGRLQSMACGMLLSGPFSDSQPWRSVATAFCRMAGGVYHSSLQQHSMAEAACRTTATTVHVLLSVAGVCLVYCVEWGFRVRFKARQLPASVAARQQHVYDTPWYMALSQMLLLVLYPTIAISWVAAGAWHGLASAAAV